MKITSVEAWPVTMRLVEPYTIAYESVEVVTNVFVRVVCDGGLVGLGCAAPDLPVTGEDPVGTQQAIEQTAASLLVGQDPLRIALLLERLRAEIGSARSAMAAIDMALWDILGKHANLPVWKLLGGFRESIKTSVTIGILPEKETVEHAEQFVKRGFVCLKIKGGCDPESDAARVLKVRDAVGPDVELRFDANQGFDVAGALQFIRLTERAKLELVEQPTPRATPDLLGRVTHQTSLPIMADESLMSLRDAFRLAQGDLVDMVNVKLMKVGGIDEALQINAVAKSAGVEVMVGCMDESALAIAAGLHYALARPNVAYADLDGHLDLSGDPAAGSIQLRSGVLYPNDEPGLGAFLSEV